MRAPSLSRLLDWFLANATISRQSTTASVTESLGNRMTVVGSTLNKHWHVVETGCEDVDCDDPFDRQEVGKRRLAEWTTFCPENLLAVEPVARSVAEVRAHSATASDQARAARSSMMLLSVALGRIAFSTSAGSGK